MAGRKRLTIAKGPATLIMVERPARDRERPIVDALIGAFPFLVEEAHSEPWLLRLFGAYPLADDDATVTDAVGAVAWAANGEFCPVAVSRYEKGQWPGDGPADAAPSAPSRPMVWA